MWLYFAKPIGIRDWDVVDAVVPAATVPVEHRCEVWKVPVQINALGICTTVGPTIQQVALKHSGCNN